MGNLLVKEEARSYIAVDSTKVAREKTNTLLGSFKKCGQTRRKDSTRNDLFFNLKQ